MKIYNNTSTSNNLNLNFRKQIFRKNEKNIWFKKSVITLNEAIRKEDIELVKNFIQKGANINPKSDEKWNKIYNVLKDLKGQNHLEMFKFLIANGLKINRTNVGIDMQTILFEAISQNNLILVEFLLTKGANVNHIDIQGFSPLLKTVYGYEFIKNINDDINDDIIKMYDIIKILIKHGANVNLKNKYGVSSFHCIVLCKDISLVEYFIENGADVNSIHEGSGGTPLHLAIREGANIRLIELLINKGADANYTYDTYGTNDNMMYSISYAFNMNKPRYIPILLAAGADDPDIKIKFSKDSVMIGYGACIVFPKKEIELAGFHAIRKRAGTICIAMQDLNLPAPQMIEIIVHTCVPFAENLPYHYLWDLVVMVKHFHDRHQAKKQLLNE